MIFLRGDGLSSKNLESLALLGKDMLVFFPLNHGKPGFWRVVPGCVWICVCAHG